MEHLTTAAQAAFGVGTATARAWVNTQAPTLRHADPAPVLAALHALPVARAPAPVAAAQTQAATLAYLTSRWDQIQYAAFQAAGYPIGSGAVESANKLGVEARLKGGGMHRARANIDPMLGLRTVACADRWAEAWPRIVQQWRRQAVAPRRQQRPDRERAAPAPPPPLVPARRPRPGAIPALPPQRTGQPHPWRRPFSTAERIRQQPVARL